MWLGLALFDHSPEYDLRFSDKLVGLGIALSIGLSILVAIFIMWTPLNAEIIEGLQGRYFIPAVPAGTLIFYNQKFKWRPVYALVTVACVASVLFITIFTLLQRYYLGG
jgi:uncharacterized membrane protein